jgi:RNA-binding protein NOB1
VLDAGPIIKSDPSISSLLSQSEEIVTLPSVIQEIRDPATRSRLQTTILPFLVLKSPKESSVKIISNFARRTGDLSVLSRTDIHLLALTYDLECERNGGDWRLRKTPGEKRINGPNPNSAKVDASATDINDDRPNISETPNEETEAPTTADVTEASASEPIEASTAKATEPAEVAESSENAPADRQQGDDVERFASVEEDDQTGEEKTSQLSEVQQHQDDGISAAVQTLQISDTSQDDNSSDSDSEGWITPSNLKKKQEEDSTGDINSAPEPKVLQVVSQAPLYVPSGSQTINMCRHCSRPIIQCRTLHYR